MLEFVCTLQLRTDTVCSILPHTLYTLCRNKMKDFKIPTLAVCVRLPCLSLTQLQLSFFSFFLLPTAFHSSHVHFTDLLTRTLLLTHLFFFYRGDTHHSSWLFASLCQLTCCSEFMAPLFSLCLPAFHSCPLFLILIRLT